MKKCVCGNEMTRHDWKNQWVCHRCGRTKPIKRIMTNAELIRSMSDEELASFWHNHSDDYCQDKPECGRCLDEGSEIPEERCIACALAWLQQPAEEV